MTGKLVCVPFTRSYLRKLQHVTSNVRKFEPNKINKIFNRSYIDSPKDVVLYEYKKSTSFNKLLAVVGVVQFGVTGYMSFVMYQSMPSFFSWIPIDESEKRDKDSKRLPLADWKYRAGFSLFTMSAAAAILFTTVIMSMRSVTSIKLLKNSTGVTIQTITPFGTPYYVTTPIMDISAIRLRSETDIGNLPLKLKNHRFHFIVDTKGKFLQPSLYDRTIGVKRDFGEEKK